MEYDLILNFKNERITYSGIPESDYDRTYRDLRKQHPKVPFIITEHIPTEFERRFGI